MRKIDQIRRSEFDDICVLLRDIDGTPHVELRTYHHSTSSDGDSLPGMEGISVPVNILPDLLRSLAQTREHLVQDALMNAASPPEEKETQIGEAIPLGTVSPHKPQSRRESRDHLKLPVRCRLLYVPDSLSRKVTGETKDVSLGGAQVWLPERFSLSSRVEVSMRIGGLLFLGMAEVVGSEVQPTNGGYRHSLRWTGLTTQEKTALSQAILDSGFVRVRAITRRESRQTEA